MSNDLMRFSVAMPEDLLVRFDHLVARLEAIVLRGETGLVQDVANMILGTKGVKNGRLVLTTTGQFI